MYKLFFTFISSLLIGAQCLASPTNLLSSDDDSWRFAVAFPVVWMPSIDGQVEFEHGDNIDINIAFEDILKNLNAGLMGSLAVAKGDWGLGLNTNYMRVKTESETQGFNNPINGKPIIAKHRITNTVHMGTNDLTLRYRVHPSIRLTTGLRHFHTKIEINFEPLTDGISTEKHIILEDQDMFDWIFGFAADHWFNDDWGVTGGADIGLDGDNDQDFNGQAFAIYRISKLNNVWLGWRHLVIGNDIDNENSEAHVKFTQSGPAFGWAFTF
ncbi:hypothetical protein [Agaribacterium sp. ZY112]|uniref:hypothetical protein n=1 Tax=Agaribacterium sp. ZY112 TaxID=3233574 RepID=UPI0035233239